MFAMKVLLENLLFNFVIIDVLWTNKGNNKNFIFYFSTMSLTCRGSPYDDGFSILPLPRHSRSWMSCRATTQGRIVTLCHCQIGAGVTSINDVGWHYGTNGTTGHTSKLVTATCPFLSHARVFYGSHYVKPALGWNVFERTSILEARLR